MMSKNLGKRISQFGIEYKCEFEPLWVATSSVEKAQMGRVHIQALRVGLDSIKIQSKKIVEHKLLAFACPAS